MGGNLELGVGTLAYGMVAGASFGLALVLLIVAQHRPGRDRALLAFGAVGITHGLNALATVRLQKSATVAEYADLLKAYGAINLLVLVSFVTLVVVLSRGAPGRLFTVFLVAALVIGVLQLALPEGLLATDIVALREVTLFGESFVVHDGSSSAWRPVLDAFLVLTLVVVGSSLWRSFRTTERSPAIVLTVCVSISVGVGMYDSLVDEGVTSTPYLAPFADLVIAVMAGAYLARQIATTERRLERQAIELEATVAERTAALLDTNEQLEDSLARQRRSTHQLATLAGDFEAVNALTLTENDRSQVTSSLEEVVANLGRLVDASTTSLRLDGLAGVASGDAPITWSPPDAPIAPAGDRSDRSTFVAPLVVRGRTLGELEVEIAGREIDEERRRYVELTAEHLAGFVERAELARHLETTAVESERERIAQELHDSVTQKLYSVSFLTEAAQSQLPEDETGAAQTVGRMREILLSSLAELRTLMFELHPSALETTRLAALLQQLCDTLESSSPLTVASTIADGELLPTDVRVGLYRIAQEALSNAARHSGADAVEVELRRMPEGVRLSVSDAGRGFDTDDLGTGYGLGNMQRRADLIGADLSITSAPGAGTRVVASWSRAGALSTDAGAATPDRAERSNA